MSETAFICTRCRHSFSMLASGAQSISCPGCGRNYEFPALQTADGRAVRVTERLAGSEKELSSLQHQNEELKRSLETSKHRASDRRLMVADQQKKLNNFVQEKAKLLQDIERLKKASALPESATPDPRLKDFELELKKTRNELQLGRLDLLRTQGVNATITAERDELIQKLHDAQIALSDSRKDITSASLSVESEKLKVFEEHLDRTQNALAAAENDRNLLRDRLARSEFELGVAAEKWETERTEYVEELEAARKCKSDGENNLMRLSNQLQEIRRAKEQAEADSASSAEVIELLNQDLQNLQEELRKTTDQAQLHKQQFDSSEVSLAEARANQEALQAQIRTLRSDRDEAVNASTLMRGDLSKMGEESDRLKKALSEANLSLEKAETMNRLLREELNSVSTRPAAVDDGTAPPEILELKKENEQIRNQMVEVRIELLKTKEQFVLSQSRLSALQADLNGKEKELTTARAELAHADREYDRISQQHQEIKQHYLLVNQKLDASRKEMEVLKDQVADLTSQLEEQEKVNSPEPPPNPEAAPLREPILKTAPATSGGFFKTFRLTSKKEP